MRGVVNLVRIFLQSHYAFYVICTIKNIVTNLNMEHTYLQAIPALATWKMLSDTIDTLHTMSTEKLFERLSKWRGDRKT